MADIYHSFPVSEIRSVVFRHIVSPESMSKWWTSSTIGAPELGGVYILDFGPGYEWRARVSRFSIDEMFELELVDAVDDWLGTRVGFLLEDIKEGTGVSFYHSGWPDTSSHFRSTSYCWAMYLRIFKRYLELGEQVDYVNRLNV